MPNVDGFDVLVCWRLDRLGRNLKHLILFLEELSALGVAFVSLAEGIDATTPAGRLQMHILGAIAEFERARIAERVRLGLARVRAQGQQLGRPKLELTDEQLASVVGLSLREAAQKLVISVSTAYRGCLEDLLEADGAFNFGMRGNRQRLVTGGSGTLI